MAVADWVVQKKEHTQYVLRHRAIMTITSAFTMKIAKYSEYMNALKLTYRKHCTLNVKLEVHSKKVLNDASHVGCFIP